jgi:hypothetical protein
MRHFTALASEFSPLAPHFLPFNLSGKYMESCCLVQHYNTLYSARKDSHKKQKLFPYTALIEWSLFREPPLSVKQELNF